MKKEDPIKLTNNLYRLTSLFPKKESLRFQTRELANEILKDLILIIKANPSLPKNLISETKRNIETLNSFLEVAKAQNWVSSDEILKVQKEYNNVEEGLKGSTETKDYPETEPSRDLLVLPEKEPKVFLSGQIPFRQEKILEILKEKEKLQVKDLKAFFPQVSKRTFRRDFEQLTKKGLVSRVGEKNDTFYQLPEGILPKLG